MTARQTRAQTLAETTKAVIRQYDFRIKKNYGQNFLIDQHVLDKIIAAAELSEDDVVVEIGPGIGTLTRALCEKAHRVVAVEIDRALVSVLADILAPYQNADVIETDVMRLDWDAVMSRYPGKRFKIVANLPYYITTPLIMSVLERRLNVQSVTVMVQKEVAGRMKASPGTKDYGALSLAVQYYALVQLVANVPLNCFLPRPAVDSAVVKLTRYDTPPVTVSDEAALFAVIRQAFSKRRKTLVNCLFEAGFSPLSKEGLARLLEQNGYDARVRGETLSLAQFAHIASLLELVQ